MEHATVRLAEFKNPIPLIGVPPSATEMECERCHRSFHLSEVQLNEAGTKFLCKNCSKVGYPSG
jgi:hypothetical protein